MTIGSLLRLSAGLLFLAAVYFGWLYVQWSWLTSGPPNDQSAASVYSTWATDSLLYAGLCLAASVLALVAASKLARKLDK